MRRKNYSSYYRSAQRPWWQTILLVLGSILALVLLTEILLRFFGSQSLVLTPTLTEKYQLSLSTSQGEPIVGSPPQGLQIKLSSILPYELVPNQKSQYWSVNAQGFRETEPVLLAKPPQEVRIFIMGGSTAFGQFAFSNENTIGDLLEKKLQSQVTLQRQSPEKFQPQVLPFFFEQVEAALALPPLILDRTYRVINSAVPGYTSKEELSLLSQQILRLQPDYLILLNGYADILEQPSLSLLIDNWLQQPGNYFRNTILNRIKRSWQRLYIVRAWQKFQPPLAIPIVKQKLDPNWLDRVQQYRYHLAQMGKLAQGKPFLVIVQPEITGNGERTNPIEKRILASLNQEYRKTIEQSLGAMTPDKLKQELPQAIVKNYYQVFNQFKLQAFVDPVHLTMEGNQFLADQIFSEVTKAFRVTPDLPENNLPEE